MIKQESLTLRRGDRVQIPQAYVNRAGDYIGRVVAAANQRASWYYVQYPSGAVELECTEWLKLLRS